MKDTSLSLRNRLSIAIRELKLVHRDMNMALDGIKYSLPALVRQFGIHLIELEEVRNEMKNEAGHNTNRCISPTFWNQRMANIGTLASQTM